MEKRWSTLPFHRRREIRRSGAGLIKLLLLVLVLFMTVSCGSGGQTGIMRGQFKDSFVEGLKFQTATQSGFTDSGGWFSYKAGETVTFSLGGVVLGSAAGDALISPVSLVPDARDENNETVLNIARLLQSLDDDGNPDNGIAIPLAVRTTLENVSLDFSSPGFGNSPAVSDLFRQINDSNVFPQKRSLVSKEAAKSHLRQSLTGLPPEVDTTSGAVLAITDSAVYNSRPSLAFDSNGRAHVVVAGDHLYHFTRYPDGWHRETIPAPKSYIYSTNTKLIIDASDYLHVFYRDSSLQLQYASNRPGYWSTEPITASDDATVDSNGNLHTVSYDTATKLYTYGTNATGRWLTQSFSDGSWNFANGYPAFFSLAVDPRGRAHLACYKGDDSTSVVYATNASGTWQVETVYQGYSLIPSSLRMVADREGEPHVAFGYYEVIQGSRICSGTCDNRDEVLYFSRVDGNWKAVTADGLDAPDGLALSVDAAGSVYLAITNLGFPSYVTSSGGSFVHHSLPPEIQVESTFDGALDSAQNWHLVLLAQDGLRYASLVEGIWQVETISLPKSSGVYANLASDAAGKQHLSFYDAQLGAVCYASNVDGTWITEVVSEGVSVDKQTSIAVDLSGGVHIAYIDSTTQELQYAKRTSGVWSVRTVAQDAYGRPALAVDSGGGAHLTFVNWRKAQQMYATNATGQGLWQVTELAWLVYFSGTYGNISVNSSGKIGICFQSISNLAAGVWLAQKDPGSATWSLAQVHAGEPGNSYCTITVDAAGTPHVAYVKYGQQQTSNKLIYATQTDGGWNSETVVQGMPGKLSLLQDAGGHPFISYYEFAQGTVNYARKVGLSWEAKELVRLNTYANGDFLAPLALAPGIQDRLYAAYFDYYIGDLNLVSIATP